MPSYRHRTAAPSAVDGLQSYFNHTRPLTTSGITSNEQGPTSRTIRFRLSGRDLPEPDARCFASYAIVYFSEETPGISDEKKRSPFLSSPKLPNIPLLDLRHTSAVTNEDHLAYVEHLQHPVNILNTGDAPTSPRPRHDSSHMNSPIPSTDVPTMSHKPCQRNIRKHRTAPSVSRSSFTHLNTLRSVSSCYPEKNQNSSEKPSKKEELHDPPSILVPFLCLFPTAPNLARAPPNALALLAPQRPKPVRTELGEPYTRSKWIRIGASEIARKDGRDVEFTTPFDVNYSPMTQRIIVKVVFFDCAGDTAENHRLIGVSEFLLRSAFVGGGSAVSFPLKFCPLSKSDRRWRKGIRDGKLVVMAETVTEVSTRYRLDVECSTILRAKALSTTHVKRAFYLIHGILSDSEDSDDWALLHRSDTVAMIHTKRDGGTKDYNYFSSARIHVRPGVIQEGEAMDGAADDVVTAPYRGGIFQSLRSAVGYRAKDRFFSLPGVDLYLSKPGTRLKLSLYEDHGQTSGFELLAATLFSIADLKKSEIGDCTALKMNTSVVGRAEMKFVSCEDDPKYFCLSLVMQSTE